MPALEFVELGPDPALMEDAAALLTRTFKGMGKDAWPTIESAREELAECVAAPNIAVGLLVKGRLAGWIGARPMYERTWELHPMLVDPALQGAGHGRALIAELERRAAARGVIGLALGTDDETEATSLSAARLDSSNYMRELAAIKNRKHHPFEFYQKCGYMIVGAIPDANGPGKPDIWMWKRI